MVKKVSKRFSDRPQGDPGHGPLGNEQLRAVAALFDALSEPSRLQILQVLRRRPANVGELVRRCGLRQANASKQLKLLLSAGVISRRKEGNRAVYSIAMPVVFDLCDLVCEGVARQAAARAQALSGL